ncbi:MAG: DUF418 domain-containing protein [Caldilineales bacterium]
MTETTTLSRSLLEATVDMAPATSGERIDSVDILRGIAVLGILLVNMGSYAGYRAPFDNMAWIDRTTTVAIRFVAQGKFYPLFAFLFGWGMAIQFVRAGRRQTNFVPFFLRRMSALLLIGLVHAVLVWHGDILVTYALLGFPLLLFRNASDRTLWLAFGICLAIPVLISLPGPAADFRVAYYGLFRGFEEAMVQGKQAGVYVTGSLIEAIKQRAAFLRYNYSASLYWITPIFGMMLLGLLVGRRGLLRAGGERQALLRRIASVTLAIGLPLNALWVWQSVSNGISGPWEEVVTRGARTIGGVSLAIFLVAALTLLSQRAAWRGQLGGFAAVGRMALTNYLLQSVVFTLIFYGYGLGVYGEAGPFLTLLLSLGFFRLQIWFSNWWLARFRFGPAEWIWRCMTYGKVQPIKV